MITNVLHNLFIAPKICVSMQNPRINKNVTVLSMYVCNNFKHTESHVAMGMFLKPKVLMI